MHWNNPGEVEGLTDDSGFRIYYTPQLRQFDAETIFFGSFQLNIPPGQRSHHEASYCPGVCTRQMFDEAINISIIYPHMHLLGNSLLQFYTCVTD